MLNSDILKIVGAWALWDWLQMARYLSVTNGVRPAVCRGRKHESWHQNNAPSLTRQVP